MIGTITHRDCRQHDPDDALVRCLATHQRLHGLEGDVRGEHEHLFVTLNEIRSREDFAVRVVEAPHYRRFLLQGSLAQRLDDAARGEPRLDFAGYESADDDGARDLLEDAHALQTEHIMRELRVDRAGGLSDADVLR